MSEQDQIREALQSDMSAPAEYAKQATESILYGAKLQMVRTYILSCIQAIDLVLAGQLPPPEELPADHTEEEMREYLADVAAKSILSHFGIEE